MVARPPRAGGAAACPHELGERREPTHRDRRRPHPRVLLCRVCRAGPTDPRELAALQDQIVDNAIGVDLAEEPDFLAPHVAVAAVETADTLDADGVAGRYDAVVYATGSERILPHLPRAIPTFEYRHVPEARAVVKVVREVLAKRGARGEAATDGRLAPAP